MVNEPDVAGPVFVQRLQLCAAPGEVGYAGGGDDLSGGLTVGVKDSIDIAGYPTRSGSAALDDAPAALHHAAVVSALLAGGCRIVGKTNLHELAYGVTGVNEWLGTPLNPRYPDRVPGGSSSGSAVCVAAGLADVAIGTDTGGSIRVPAACCGVYGLKPSFGRIDRRGVHPAQSSLDCVGPFARSVELIERAMALMDPSFGRGRGRSDAVSGVRIGLVDVACEPAIEAAVRAAVTQPGIVVTRVSLPSFEQAFAAGLTLIGAENWRAYQHLVDSPRLGAYVRARLLAARDVTADAVAAAESVRQRFRAEVDAALDAVDALALPTLPDYPLTLAAAADASRALRMTALVRQFNVSGHPALSMPLRGLLPIGLQVVGRQGQDEALCAVARRLVEFAEAYFFISVPPERP